MKASTLFAYGFVMLIFSTLIAVGCQQQSPVETEESSGESISTSINAAEMMLEMQRKKQAQRDAEAAAVQGALQRQNTQLQDQLRQVQQRLLTIEAEQERAMLEEQAIVQQRHELSLLAGGQEVLKDRVDSLEDQTAILGDRAAAAATAIVKNREGIAAAEIQAEETEARVTATETRVAAAETKAKETEARVAATESSTDAHAMRLAAAEAFNAQQEDRQLAESKRLKRYINGRTVHCDTINKKDRRIRCERYAIAETACIVPDGLDLNRQEKERLFSSCKYKVRSKLWAGYYDLHAVSVTCEYRRRDDFATCRFSQPEPEKQYAAGAGWRQGDRNGNGRYGGYTL